MHGQILNASSTNMLYANTYLKGGDLGDADWFESCK